MGQSLPRISPDRIERLQEKNKIHECGGGGGGPNRWEQGGPRLERTKNTISTDEDFQLRQQCTWAGKTTTMKRCDVYFIECVGPEISFAYLPEMRTDAPAHRILQIPPSFVNSTDICMLYHELCRRIYASDLVNGSTRPGDVESDVCLWITPYIEIRMERNMHGVMERKVIKGSRRGRLRHRTLLVKWMLECSDWQEQLARNFWGLPKRGVGRDVTLPWFSLEVEYRPNGRKKLFDSHKNEFEVRGITWGMFSQPEAEAAAKKMMDDNIEAIPSPRRVVFEERRVRFRTAEAATRGREVATGAGGIIFPGGEAVVGLGGVIIGEREVTVGVSGKLH